MKKLMNISEIKNLEILSSESTKEVKGGGTDGDWILVTNPDGSREWRRPVKL